MKLGGCCRRLHQVTKLTRLTLRLTLATYPYFHSWPSDIPFDIFATRGVPRVVACDTGHILVHRDEVVPCGTRLYILSTPNTKIENCFFKTCAKLYFCERYRNELSCFFIK
jgi:hypothetical protein